MDLDELKKNWKDVNERLERLEKNYEQLRQVQKRKNSTARERLISYHERLTRMMWILGACYIVMGILRLVAHGDSIDDYPLSWWVLLSIGLFSIVAAVVEQIITRRVREINVWEMTVMEVSRRARNCRRMIHQFQMAGIPVALLIVGAIVWEMRDNEWGIAGVATGAAVGLAAGLYLYSRLMRNYRCLIRTDDIED